jgi:adenylate cyclase
VIDTRLERRLMAVLAADVAGYSRLVGNDEEGTLTRWKAHWRETLEPKLAEHRGRVIRVMGDGILVEFASVVDAVQCAIEVQRRMAEQNAELPVDSRIEFRVGINVGEIVINEQDVWGEGVNIAARLEALSTPGGICVSGRVHEDVQGKLKIDFEDTGEHQLKNISRPIRVYRVRELGAVSYAKMPLPGKPSIAVLRFQNLSGDDDQQYFADGMVEEIITELSRMRWLFVIAGNSSFAYNSGTANIHHVARELGVRYVLEGSIRKASKRVRVTSQLVDAATGHHVWAERYDRELSDTFEVQDEITDRVMEAIAPQLYAAEGIRAKRKPPDSLDAWECVVRAITLINERTESDAAAAEKLLRNAVSLDPAYARAHSLMAFLMALEVHSGWKPREPALTLALDVAHNALSLDPDDPWTYAALGFVLAEKQRIEEAVAQYRKAIALNPNFSYGHTMLAATLCYLGQGGEAIAETDIAERLSPRDFLVRGNRGANNVMRAAACMVDERYRDGISFARRAIIENPSSIPAYRQLVINSALAGDLDDARLALQVVRRLQPEISLSWLSGWVPFRRQQDRDKYVEGFRLAGLDKDG